MIKAVIFDLDGVLIDTEYRQIMIKVDVCTRYGLNWTEDTYTTAAGSKFTDILPLLFPDMNKRELKEIRDEYYRVGYDGIDYHSLRIPGAGMALNALYNQGYRIAIASMSFKDKIKEVLEVNHWDKFVETFVSRDDVTKRKPDPDAYLQAMKKLGLSSEECVIVEDSHIGIEAAKAAGCKCICRRENRYPSNQIGADYYIDEMTEVVRIVNEIDEIKNHE